MKERFSDIILPDHSNSVWTSEAHTSTSVERKVHQTLHRGYLVGSLFAVVCMIVLVVAGFTIYRQATHTDPVKPDYSSLDTDSDTYWTDRILLDITTARQSVGTDELRLQRLRTFAHQTADEALAISSSYLRAQAVTSIAMVLAQSDTNITLDRQLQHLGNTPLIASMRARVLISQALSHLRQGSPPAAQATMQQYIQLIATHDLKLNSPINEESFFGAVTVLWFLNDREGLSELFTRLTASAAVVGLDQQMRAYRLIAGEQVRAGMISEALETAKRITNHVELTRALTLILQYSARPPEFLPVEPTMLELYDVPPPTDTQEHTVFTECAADDIFLYLAENRDLSAQASLLRRVIGSLLVRDTELLEFFQQRLIESEVLDDRVKQQVLRRIDASVSSAHQTDPTGDDWTTPGGAVHVEIVNIDSTPLRTRTDQQWVQALLAIAQGYQSIKRFHDADRVLKQAFVVSQRFGDSNIRIPILLQLGEQQVTIGSIADAKQTFATVALEMKQNQKEELARLQIIARLFDDAMETISSIESPENREYVCTFLMQEQIRLNRLNDAGRTLSLLSQGRTEREARSRLNIAREQASPEDFNVLRIPIPEGNEQHRERHCIGLIQQGFLRLAGQAAERLNDEQKRTTLRTRIAGEYLLLYQAFNNHNDPNRSIRQSIRQEFLSAVERIRQPVIQATLLMEFLAHLTGQLRTEEERTEGQHLWLQTMAVCRNIAEPSERATLFARLIVAKNMLDNPNLARRTFPLFTTDTNPAAIEATNRLIDECLELVNSLDREEQQANACVYLARALAQIGRTTSAQMLLDYALNIATNVPREESVSILLLMVPTLNAMNSADTISTIYRLAIDAVAHEFLSRSSSVDEFEWRMRDSDIERIVRSQMENGFVDDAVESANRLNEPLLRDRLLRAAIYVYLDHRNFDRAESLAQRLTERGIQNRVVQNIQTIKRRSAAPQPVPDTQE